ncbi:MULTISPECIES: copper-binding protein [unclassified Polaromonas]|jgi:Cu/Ag efflux protein CusF|uniref:copper-binding protein n=1 Tax=unclassified Polaromonas TaxID=2638319 RepID=UPI0018CB2CDF|nr:MULTISPECIES: copper-binding protein [unclassified Polaromonas]MBG6073801.1 Cu/Ag efflux protein CusF [Polaromonas sp. CG_9.7]MBG6115897.1 Cu/Ag efflux protein CusF [Polaromonas sp. CG_9.2]MDH6185949.1 Cu/Ag efflux protein CusF [Polaromonas sp. CG_23.6]
MKTEINALLMAAALFAGSSGVAMAASDVQTSTLSETAMPAVSAKLTSGEVRKIDTEQGKLTIKHEAIENLQMPGMTMVFKATDPAMLEKMQVGDKIKFAAEKSNGALVITAIEAAM